MRGQKHIETDETKKLIAEMTAAGAYQNVIVRELGWSGPGARNRVGRVQKELGLALDRHGPKCSELTEAEKAKVLELLPRMGYQKVAVQLGLREVAVREVSEQLGFVAAQAGFAVGVIYRKSSVTRSM